MTSQKLALFDLDNTLIDRSALFRRWALAFLRVHQRDASDLDWLVECDSDGLIPREPFFEAVRGRYGITTTTADLVAAYYADYPTFTVPPPPPTVAALLTLREKGWRLAIVTNGPPMQEAVIDQADLRGSVDSVCVSSNVGLRKPDPAIFQLAADRCGVPLAGSWMVGDSAAHDIAGAVAAGINSVWITRGRSWLETQYQPTVIADTVGDAISILMDRDATAGEL